MLRYSGLDILRVIAIFFVVTKHSHNYLNDSLKIIVDYFPDPVDLFFVISGFLIGNLFIKTFDNKNPLSANKVFTFIIRRWFRTLPLYYLFLFINILLVSFNLIPGYVNKYVITYFVFYQNLFKPYDFLFWESWSLSIEEWFYFLMPFLTLALWYKSKSLKLAYLIGAIFLLLFSITYKVFVFDPNLSTDLFIRKIVFCRFDTIAIGLLGAFIFNYYFSFWKRHALSAFIVGLFVWLTLYGGWLKSLIHPIIYYSTSGIFIVLMFPLLTKINRRLKLISYLSKISYPMYLIHLPLIHLILVPFAKNELNNLFYLVVLLAISHLVYKYIQSPIVILRDKIRPQHNPLKEPAAEDRRVIDQR